MRKNRPFVSAGGKRETVETVSPGLRRNFTWLKPGVNGISSALMLAKGMAAPVLRNGTIRLTVCLTLAGCFLAGCGKSSTESSPAILPAKHQHIPPHGGTPVVLGNEEYHLELVLDAPAATMQAYVLDGEMEEFVRVAAPSFEVAVKQGGDDIALIFNAVTNRATGETVGDTSQFAAHADWLKSTKTFDGVLKVLAVKDTVYKHVPFNFPKGNDTDDK
jgi:hypothetical protein